MAGRGFALPAELSIAFDSYLNTLPWQVSSLDWSRMPSSVTLDVAKSNLADFQIWLTKTRIGGHQAIAVWYSRTEGGLVIPIESATLDNLDELYWAAAGTRYLCGVDLENDRPVPAYADLLERGEGDLYIAVSR